MVKEVDEPKQNIEKQLLNRNRKNEINIIQLLTKMLKIKTDNYICLPIGYLHIVKDLDEQNV